MDILKFTSGEISYLEALAKSLPHSNDLIIVVETLSKLSITEIEEAKKLIVPTSKLQSIKDIKYKLNLGLLESKLLVDIFTNSL